MICRQCEHTNSAGAKFCEECGAPLARSCSNCGHKLSNSAKFCDECGANATPSSAGSDKHMRPGRTPVAYTPKHLADKILQSKSALEGERKQVTVMFADVKSSMELAEQLDPEKWHEILDRFFAILTDGVHRFEGTLNEYAAAIEYTGMRFFDRELNELRTLLSERTR